MKNLFNNRPKVFWWSIKNKDNSVNNFGDILTPYIIEKISHVKPVFLDSKSNYRFLFKNSIMVGSILSKSNNQTLVWGSGIIKKNESIVGGKFLAVRGPRSEKRIIELGLGKCNLHGDPAILLPLLYKVDKLKKYRYGIVCHYVDYDDILTKLKGVNDILIINTLCENIEDVISEISQCEFIVSSSLHGIIVANAYNIPAKWWKFSNKLGGDDVKFYDYFESMQLNNIKPSLGNDINYILKENNFIKPKLVIIKKLQMGLLKSYPYKIKNKELKNFLKK